jgi:hypothetical protein
MLAGLKERLCDEHCIKVDRIGVVMLLRYEAVMGQPSPLLEVHAQLDDNLLLTRKGRELQEVLFFHPISMIDFKTGALDAALNCVIPVNYLASDILPHLHAPGVTSIGIGATLMNLISGWFGAKPVCHGSGGLAAQYRFGARSGASIIILGLFNIIFGQSFGESLVSLFTEYPKAFCMLWF